jgi:hypothetical protein
MFVGAEAPRHPLRNRRRWHRRRLRLRLRLRGAPATANAQWAAFALTAHASASARRATLRSTGTAACCSSCLLWVTGNRSAVTRSNSSSPQLAVHARGPSFAVKRFAVGCSVFSCLAMSKLTVMLRRYSVNDLCQALGFQRGLAAQRAEWVCISGRGSPSEAVGALCLGGARPRLGSCVGCISDLDCAGQLVCQDRRCVGAAALHDGPSCPSGEASACCDPDGDCDDEVSLYCCDEARLKS